MMQKQLAEDTILTFITAPNQEEAARIAGALIEERLAACVNITGDIRSIYRWQGKIEDDTEVLMIAKTRKSLFAALSAKVKELHSYDVPEIIAVSLADGSAEYLTWIQNSTVT